MSMNDTFTNLADGIRRASACVAVATTAIGATAAVAAETSGKGGFDTTATLGQLVEFQFTGLLVVFVVLGALTFMCYFMGWVLKKVAPDQYYGKPKGALAPAVKVPTPAIRPVVPPAAPVVATAPATIHPGLSDEQLMAILAVAATETLGQAVAVVKFRPLDSMDWTWSIQGRVQHHSSHAL